ncbi:hypothetical protein RO3G_09630 [Rhizopus delemar RA 99-880]|uniref:Uncharacterized protein n=1 Tax=Rhizopus delemar (strain RA 99-880 / ATCC MYA-4621 / FGSC 9543 / NRRL 43880) TaxID=246409 RepID=I1C8Z0_RHIO9|nr:hypothetical protein RO3G_09630 [Rhizopus delemar RA 99-880]|eukprot:EIE84920.1 hypothetical protein RO3G_09630 [Rhizopus delemar RA 99-880]
MYWNKQSDTLCISLLALKIPKQAIIYEFLTTPGIFTAFRCLRFSIISYCQTTAISAMSALIISLGNMWASRCMCIFQQTEFIPRVVHKKIRHDIS